MTARQHQAVKRIAHLATEGVLTIEQARRGIALVCGEAGRPQPGHPGGLPLPEPESLEAFTKRAAAAFESDMEPVSNAIVAALQANDMDALKGLRALLPHLLAEVNAQPALADLLAHQLGKALMDGIQSGKQESGDESGKQESRKTETEAGGGGSPGSRL